MREGDVVAGRFELLRLAGSGGMARVYRARDRETGGTVALKLTFGARPDDARRFAREGRTLADLSHPGIVRYVAHGTTGDGECFLAMEWLEGEDLQERLTRGGLSLAEVVALGRRAGEALGAAHRAGVVHRDVKPSNLFLPGGDVERCKLLDFGIAQLEEATRRLTRTGMTMGTPGYMSPEQARGERDLDARADVFALGCVLFECVTGRPAFVAGHPMALLGMILFEESPRLRSLRAETPPELDDLVARMLAKAPEERPADGDDVARALAAVPVAPGVAPGPRLEARPAALTRNEQRIVSVVLAATAVSPESAPTVAVDLAGAPTSPGAGVEDQGEAAPPSRRPPLEALREAARRHGARVEALADGSIVAVLPGSRVPTEQAARAARCALAMRAALPGVPMVLATGRGVVDGDLPVGEVIDRAARALAGAPGDAVRLDEITAGLLDARFDVAFDAGPGAIGDAPSGPPTIRDASGPPTDVDERPPPTLRGERGAELAVRTLLGKPTPCVGRERELALLAATFESCASDRAASAVLVTGGAGAGKSRLADELLRDLRGRGEDVEILVARGDPLSAGSAFGLLGPARRRRAGVLEGEPAAVQRRKVRGLVSRRFPTEQGDRIARFLGQLMAVDFEHEASLELSAARDDALLMGDQIRAAWEAWLAGVCAVRPLLVVLEDLQWGDLPTVQAVDGALRSLRDAPLMILALARPEVHDRFPRLWADRQLVEVRLGGLPRRAAERLVREALGPDEPAAATIVERADGNPLFLEELIRAAAHGKRDALPETVIGMVQARFDALDPEARRVLRAASVFGGTFWPSGVGALLGGASAAEALDGALEELERQELVRRRAEAVFPGEREYGFEHATVREAAYAMLTDADATLGHRLAGEWLAAKGERDALVLAEHFERGRDVERALRSYERAADLALEANDYEAAAARAERGVLCGADGAALGRLRLLQAEAYGWRGDFERAAIHARWALRSVERGSEDWFRAAGEAVYVAAPLGEHEEVAAIAADLCRAEPTSDDARTARARAGALARAAIQLALLGRAEEARRVLSLATGVRSSGSVRADPMVAARRPPRRAFAALAAGEPELSVAEHRAARAEFERAGAHRHVQAALGFASFVDLELGRHADAEAGLRESLAGAEKMGLTFTAALLRINLSYALLRAGKTDDVLVSGARVAFGLSAIQDRRVDAISRGYLAEILALGGDLGGAEREARQGVEKLGAFPPFKARALGILAHVLLARGRSSEALAAAEEGMAILASVGTTLVGESLLRLTLARARAAAGDAEGARAALDAARDRLLARAAAIGDPDVRRSFLAVPENAQTLGDRIPLAD